LTAWDDNDGMNRAAALVVVTLLAAAGCGSGERPIPPTGASDLVLRVSDLPGLLPLGGTAAVPPSFSLYGDGRLIVPTGGGAWPMFTEHRVPPAEVSRLLGAAADAGLLDGADRPAAGPDGPVVVVTAASVSQRHTVKLPRSDRSVAGLRAELGRLATDHPGTGYRPAAVAVIAVGNEVPGPARDWTLSALDDRCTVLRGSEVDAAQQLAATADATTIWRFGDRRWSLAFRPLLPDEPDCTALLPPR